METAAVVDGILNWKWKLEHENLTNLAELLSHLVAFLSSEAFDIKKQHRMINYLPNGFGKQNVNSTPKSRFNEARFNEILRFSEQKPAPFY